MQKSKVNPPAGGQNENVKCKNYVFLLKNFAFLFFILHFEICILHYCVFVSYIAII